MTLQELKASSERHKALMVSFKELIDKMNTEKGFNLDLMTLAKLVSSRDLSAIGLSNDLPAQLTEFIEISNGHCSVIDAVINDIENRTGDQHVESPIQ